MITGNTPDLYLHIINHNPNFFLQNLSFIRENKIIVERENIRTVVEGLGVPICTKRRNHICIGSIN